MWPFSSRSARSGTIVPAPTELPPFTEFVRNDSSIKVWLPQNLSDHLNWLSRETDVSRSDVIRAMMFEHFYGRIAYEALLTHVRGSAAERTLQAAREIAAQREDLERRNARRETPRWSTGDAILSVSRHTGVDLQYIGKSTENFKLDLPKRMKHDLQHVARNHGLTASHYVRKMLVQLLLGERIHSDWRAAVGQVTREVEQLEQDD